MLSLRALVPSQQQGMQLPGRKVLDHTGVSG
jgi:hypothetical protein